MNPPPVPDTPTDISTPGLTAVNSSATACVIGKTVEDPSISIDPVKPASLLPLSEATVVSLLAVSSDVVGSSLLLQRYHHLHHHRQQEREPSQEVKTKT
ncbi:MAG: hypothetical protein ACJ0GJ_05315 [Candidatus Actinomarina sp.]